MSQLEATLDKVFSFVAIDIGEQLATRIRDGAQSNHLTEMITEVTIKTTRSLEKTLELAWNVVDENRVRTSGAALLCAVSIWCCVSMLRCAHAVLPTAVRCELRVVSMSQLRVATLWMESSPITGTEAAHSQLPALHAAHCLVPQHTSIAQSSIHLLHLHHTNADCPKCTL